MAIAVPQSTDEAPDGPGVTPTWSPGQKDAVTTALGNARVWATVGHGIVNEVYWPSAGDPQVRDLGFIVAGNGAWQEVKVLPGWTIATPEPDVPIPTVVHAGTGWTLIVEIVPDPQRDVLLLSWQLQGVGVKLYPLLAPHLEVHQEIDPADQGPVGADNQAWVAGDNSLIAMRDGAALCLASDLDQWIRAR